MGVGGLAGCGPEPEAWWGLGVGGLAGPGAWGRTQSRVLPSQPAPSPQAAMTKLAQWLCALALLGSAWAALALSPAGLRLPEPFRQALLPLPVYLLVTLGCFSLAAVGFRLATFNDCEEAAAELQEHIAMARADLRLRGLRFSPQ